MKLTSLFSLFLVHLQLYGQSLPEVSEPPKLTLYRWYHNLVQLRLDPYDYNEYMISCEQCEVALEDRNGEKLAPNNFIVTLGWEAKGDVMDLVLFDRSNPNSVLKTFQFTLVNPPDAIICLDGIAAGGTCTRSPKKLSAQIPEDAPIKLFYTVNNWQMIVGDTVVYGDGDEINAYARSIIEGLPSGTKVEFKCMTYDENGMFGYRHAEYVLE